MLAVRSGTASGFGPYVDEELDTRAAGRRGEVGGGTAGGEDCCEAGGEADGEAGGEAMPSAGGDAALASASLGGDTDDSHPRHGFRKLEGRRGRRG